MDPLGRDDSLGKATTDVIPGKRGPWSCLFV
jgi:hypothetical protein